jgi:UDP:flavonoid glycosyltransferase YjiC (YdhE family)
MTTSPSPRRYLFALVDGGGTVPPELGVVRRLVERGHHVTVLAEDSMSADVRSTGAVLRPWVTAPNRATRLPDDDPWRDWECSNPMALFARLRERVFVGPAPEYAADTTAAIDDVRPDLVVCSFFAIGAMAAAEAAGLPFDVLFPNAYLLPTPGIPPVGLGLAPARGAAGRIRDRFVTALTRRQWDKGLPGLNDMRASLGLPPVETFFDQVHRARRELVLTSAGFDFPGTLPPNVRYVGAVLDDPAWAAASWDRPGGDRPLVLVALSSTFQDQGACLQRVVDAVGSLPVDAIVTTGPAIDPASLDAPAGVTIVRAAPHSAILGHAAAVVTHGGHGTVVRALAAGVPLVVLPHGRDQADNGRRVTSRGAGIVLSRNARPTPLATAIRRVLDDPAFAAAAGELGATIRADAAGDALLGELEAVPDRSNRPSEPARPGRM